MTVFDTGAGPNLIRADMLPDELLSSFYSSRDVVNLAGAGGHRLNVLGFTLLHVLIGALTCTQPFVVVRTLGANALLGTTFIDSQVEAIWIRQRRVVLNNGYDVDIYKRPGWRRPTIVRTNEDPSVEPPTNGNIPIRVSSKVSLAL